VIIGGKFWADHTKELIEFTRKLERGWLRVRDRHCDALTLWTVKRTEARVACGYLKLTWRAWRCADSPISNELGFGALHTALILHKVLDWTRGQPRRTAAQATRLLDEYRRTPSSERYKYSGARIREARQQVEDAAILEEIIAEYRQYEGAIPASATGDELLQLMRERYFDFADDILFGYEMHRSIQAAIRQLIPEIATIQGNGGLRW
jgi:hypothetical protein